MKNNVVSDYIEWITKQPTIVLEIVDKTNNHNICDTKYVDMFVNTHKLTKRDETKLRKSVHEMYIKFNTNKKLNKINDMFN